MPERASDGGVDSRDPPEVIATRRKARVSGRFRSTPQVEGGLAGPTSAFSGMTKPGFVFGVPSSGSGSSGASGGIAAAVPATSTHSIATGGFSFPNNAAATTPAPPPPQPQVKLLPQTSGGPLDSSATSLNAQSRTSAGGTGLTLGEGRTALQGGRLNKRFSSWISRCLAGDTAVFLDCGLRDYAAFAADIRERADLEKVKTSTSTAFRHPSGAAAAASVSQASPKVSSASISSAPPASAAATTLPPEATPTLPHPVAQTRPAFSFSVASTLPEAPSGQHFSFAVPSASASTSTSAASSAPLTPSSVAPSVISPSGGFQFNAAGLGTVGAPAGVFKGFQLPSGVAIPPPVATGSSAAGAEEDGMPKEDPSKLERAPGEENEEIMGQFRAKLFRFKKDEKAWGDMGVGMLRLMKHTTSDGRRLVLRNDMGKVILNAAVYRGMVVTKTTNAIKFLASVADDGPTSFLVKVTEDKVDLLHTRVVGLVPS